MAKIIGNAAGCVNVNLNKAMGWDIAKHEIPILSELFNEDISMYQKVDGGKDKALRCDSRK